MSGFDTGSGSYDKVAHVRGGEGLGIDAQTAGECSTFPPQVLGSD